MRLDAAFDCNNYTLTFLATVIASCICGAVVVFILKIIVELVDIVNNCIKSIKTKREKEEEIDNTTNTIDHYTEDNEPVNKYGHVVNSSVGGGFQ